MVLPKSLDTSDHRHAPWPRRATDMPRPNVRCSAVNCIAVFLMRSCLWNGCSKSRSTMINICVGPMGVVTAAPPPPPHHQQNTNSYCYCSIPLPRLSYQLPTLQRMLMVATIAAAMKMSTLKLSWNSPSVVGDLDRKPLPEFRRRPLVFEGFLE